MYTEDYEQEIDLKDLLFVLLYRWRILLLAAVIGAALLGGYKAVKGNAKQPAPFLLFVPAPEIRSQCTKIYLPETDSAHASFPAALDCQTG